jgi:hypothetical protein
MKTVLFFMALILVATGAIAAPWLVCDPQTGVDTYNVTIDGITTTGVSVLPAWIKDGKILFTDPGGTRTSVHVLKDLSFLPTGPHTATAQACSSLWGCSAATSAFPFTKSIPVVPTTTLIVGQ